MVLGTNVSTTILYMGVLATDPAIAADAPTWAFRGIVVLQPPIPIRVVSNTKIGRQNQPIRRETTMKIVGIEGMTANELNMELQTGGKFVVFQYCISIVVLTFKRSSDIYFIKGGESTFSKSIGYTILTLLVGWWGIPWGPIYTIGSLITNFGGGKDVTPEVIAVLSRPVIESDTL